MARLRVRRCRDGAEIEVDEIALRWAVLDQNARASRVVRATVSTEWRQGSVPVLPDEIGTYDRVDILGEVDPTAEDLADQPLPRARGLRPATAGEEREVRTLGAILRRALRRETKNET